VQAHYNTGTLANLVVAVPPLGEQRTVLDELAAQISPITRSTGTAQREIVLLREYRTRLIADVVTGKLDVREAAARLPDEAEESGPLDEVQVLPEDSENGEGADLEGIPEEAEA
jgi:type I restriction enzyme S subunit